MSSTLIFAQEIYKTEKYENIPINEIQKSEIGISMIEKGTLNIYEALKIDYYPKKEKYLGKEISIDEGDILLLSKIDKKGKVFYDKRGTKDAPQYQGILIVNNDYDNPKLFTHNPTLHPLSRKIELKVTKIDQKIICNECLKQQFIYNGKSGNQIKFIYREFINDMARPAFTQELQYDLSEGNIIGFKGLRIEIISISNIEIEYKIINSFN
jgi:hypothetical protein